VRCRYRCRRRGGERAGSPVRPASASAGAASSSADSAATVSSSSCPHRMWASGVTHHGCRGGKKEKGGEGLEKDGDSDGLRRTCRPIKTPSKISRRADDDRPRQSPHRTCVRAGAAPAICCWRRTVTGERSGAEASGSSLPCRAPGRHRVANNSPTSPSPRTRTRVARVVPAVSAWRAGDV
jgi:hypothetical protein